MFIEVLNMNHYNYYLNGQETRPLMPMILNQVLSKMNMVLGKSTQKQHQLRMELDKYICRQALTISQKVHQCG